MRKIFFVLAFLFFRSSLFAQEKKVNSADELMKESIYNANKKTVMNFTMKDFDKLFFEFFQKKASESLILTKEEFYNYTIKIGIFSDRLAALYPKEKQTAADSKKKWFAENYEDYLHSKQNQKK
jgi:isocitrate dehydrogenase